LSEENGAEFRRRFFVYTAEVLHRRDAEDGEKRRGKLNVAGTRTTLATKPSHAMRSSFTWRTQRTKNRGSKRTSWRKRHPRANPSVVFFLCVSLRLRVLCGEGFSPFPDDADYDW